MDRFDQHGLRASARATRSSRVARRGVCSSSSPATPSRRAGEEMNPGLGRDVVLAVGKPAGWSPTAAARAARRRRHGVALARRRSSTRRRLRSPRRRRTATRRAAGHARRLRPRRSAPKPRRRGRCTRCWSPATRCRRRSTTSLARALAAEGRQGDARRRTSAPASRRPSSSTGASSRPTRSSKDKPDAVVVFIGANEGFPIDEPRAAARSTAAAPTGRRLRQPRAAMMNTYRQAAPRASTG